MPSPDPVAATPAVDLARLLAPAAAGAGPVIGWKLGFGTPAAMAALGTPAPLVGAMTEASRVAPGATVDVSGWTAPAIEPELAVVLGRDLDGDASRDEAASAVRAVAPSIELVDVDGPLDDLDAILARRIFHRGVVLGAFDRAGLDVADVRLDLRVGGEERAAGVDAGSAAGDLAEHVRHVAATLAACGERLRAGHVIITGSVVPPVRVAAGTAVEASFRGLGSVALTLA